MNKNQLWLSHSKMDVARQCMKKFNYQYIDKVEIEDDDQDTSAADFGSCIHEIAENYTGGGKAELLALYHKLVPEKYTISDKYKAKIGLALKNVHTYFKKYLMTQKSFKNELDIKVEYNDLIMLTGKIDVLIEKVDGGYRVVDYKTKKSNKYFDPTDQLAMYMLMMNKEYKIPYSKIDCEIVYLSMDGEDKYGNHILNEGYENTAKVYKVTPEDVEILSREIETLYKRINKNIESGEWMSNPTKFNCTYCKYNKICEDSIAEKP